ncbi:MAG TPA: penicillin-binding transpeptidase domain-containing protein [Thermomicrobiales bacterium]|nr:penicillin-binding transpeptidase domain-containing protein [Thermomicrobiales bacterium]
MARRKRIPYDPPHKRKRRRRRNDFMRADQIFLNRRMFVAKAGVVAAFGALATKLGIMQIQRGEEFRAEAEQNSIRAVKLPAPRGLILDREGRRLAENRRSWEVRVIKAELPEEGTPERTRVLDTLVAALSLEDVLTIRPSAVPRGSQDTILQRVANMLGYEGDQAAAAIEDWQRQIDAGVGYILVTHLDIDGAARFRSATSELPGVSVMNELDYLIGSVWAPRLPVPIKKDVPREVALQLKANLMYLPGVEIDDSSLSRVYRGGEVMSHVIGYVRPIDAASLYDPRNMTPGGNQIYDQNDVIGAAGLEQSLEEHLRGAKGNQFEEVDVNGVRTRTIQNTLREAVPGENITLTIDLELQQAMGRALEKAIQQAADLKRQTNVERKAKGLKEWKIPNAGTVVAYDPRSGEILGMVSYPYYDNQLFVSGLSGRKWDEYLNPEKGKAFVNRAVSEVYPPGSTFKVFLAASALSHGTLTTDQTYTCKGAIRVPFTYNLAEGNNYACWVAWQGGTPHEATDIYGAIAESCDVFFYNAAVEYTMPQDAFEPIYYYDYDLNARAIVSDERHVFNGLGIDPIANDMQTKFWFGRRTGIELSEESGLFPDPDWKRETFDGEGWSVGDTINVSIGQGEFTATPLQIAMNVGALAMNGRYFRPHLVARRTDAEGKVTEIGAEKIGELGIEQDHLAVVQEGMRRVVHTPEGTAHVTEGQTKWPLTNPEGEEEILIGGKTGTAEYGEADEGYEDEELNTGARDTHAWFTCYAPWDEPEIAIAVVIEAGGEGSTVAVPVADETLRAYFELTGRRERGTVLSQEKMPV